MTWVAGNRGFLAGGSTGVSTGSIAASGSNLVVIALDYIGTGATPASPLSVVWNTTEALSAWHTAVTWETNFRAGTWIRKAPTATSAVVTTLYLASHDEVMLLAGVYSGIDQTTTWRTPLQTVGPSVGNSPSLAVTSVSGDQVIGLVAFDQASGPVLVGITSTITQRFQVAGTDINSPNTGGFEACAFADSIAAGTSTSVGFTVSTTSGTASSVLFGASLIPAAGGAATSRPVSPSFPMALMNF